MLKGQLFQTLNQYLGEYLYGFNPDQLRLAVLNGNIKLKNLTFRPDKINDHLLMMGSPVLLKAGIIGNITVDINYIDWSKNEIILEDLLIILGPNFNELKTRKNYVSNDEAFLNLSRKFEEYMKQDTGNAQEDPDRRGLDMNHIMGHESELNKLYREQNNKETTKVNPPKKDAKELFKDIKANLPKDKKDIFSIILGLDVLATQRFMAKNIHIRYEDDQMVPRHPISCGFLIESILLHPNPNMDIYIPSSKDSQVLGYYNTEKKTLDDFWKGSKERKNLVQQLLINNVEVYVNSASEMYIPFSLYQETLYSPNGIFEAIPPLELKALMKQYLEHDDVYKFTLFKIERVELHYMISSNLKPEPLRENFLLINTTIFNMYLNVKPGSVEDILDLVQYFEHFTMWKYLEDFKPSIRPVLNPKLINSRPATKRTRRMVIKEWWRSVLWYIRIRKLLQEKREETIPELYMEYCKSSWLKILENFVPRSRQTTNRDYQTPVVTMGAEDFRKEPIWDQQVLSKKIFKEEEEPKQKEIKNPFDKLQSEKVKNVLNKMKNILIMGFSNIYNINVAVKKNNGKTFLLMRIDQGHASALKNYDFKDSNVATIQVNNIRLFLCQSEKQKKIFEASKAPKKESLNNIFQTTNYPNTKASPLIQQDLKEIQRVMESPMKSQRSDPLRNAEPKTSNFGTLVTPQVLGSLKPSPISSMPMLDQNMPINFQGSIWPNTALPSGFVKPEDDLKRSVLKPSTDLLLLELKNDIILKQEIRPSAKQGIQFQTKMEINEININMDAEIIINILEYSEEINQIYYVKLKSFDKSMKETLDSFKFQAEKKVLVFERPVPEQDFLSDARSHISAQKSSNILIKESDPVQNIRSQNSIPPADNANNIYERKMTKNSGGYSEQNFRPIMNIENPDTSNIFLTKLNDFLECNEFLVSINFDGLTINLTENGHSVERKADLMNIQLPKGKINVSFNFNKKNAYIVDVFGFRVETSSKFKALHFLYKRIKNLVKNTMEEYEDEKKIYFYDFLLKQGAVKGVGGTDLIREHYSPDKRMNSNM